MATAGRGRPGRRLKVPATLRLTREGALVELRRGTFDVLVDGKSIASIESHGEVEIPVDPGHHTLQVRKARYSSRTLTFDVPDGDSVTFRCYGANLWFIYVASIALPSLGLKLTQT
jgi:hypothetical protein